MPLSDRRGVSRLRVMPLSVATGRLSRPDRRHGKPGTEAGRLGNYVASRLGNGLFLPGTEKR